MSASRYRRGVGLVGGFLALAALFVTPAAASQPGQVTSAVSEVVGAMVITLIVCGGFAAFAPEYAERTTDRIYDEPVSTFLYGIGLLLLSVVVLVLLLISIVGIVVAIPLAVLLIVVGELGYVAAGRSVTDSWIAVVLVAVAVSAFVGGVPVVGALVGFVLGSVGIGAAFLEYSDDGTSRSGSTTSTTTASLGASHEATDQYGEPPGSSRGSSERDDVDDGRRYR